MISIPFSGNKMYSYKNVKAIAQENNYKRVFEPFGGSCVLSVNLLNDKLVEEAIVNDYDHFFDFYPEYLNLKDIIVSKCYEKGLKKTIHKGKKKFKVDGDNLIEIPTETLDKKDRETLQQIITETIPEEYWGYLFYDNNFVFSAREKDRYSISDFRYFKSNLTTDKQREYLNKLSECSIEHLDWKDFINKFNFYPNDLIILDPPYLGAKQKQYKGQFNIYDTVELVKTVKEIGCDFIFFNQDIKLVEQLTDGLDCQIDYTGCITASANRNRKDVMAFVKNSDTHFEYPF